VTDTEALTVVSTMVQLIERRIRDKAWLYWPPGPMMGQVFDRERCERDVRQLVQTIQSPARPPQEPTPPISSGWTKADREHALMQPEDLDE
jgi:hypothetical protein